MTRNLLTALATLTLFGCGSTELPVTSSHEVDPSEGASAVTRAQQALKSQKEMGEELLARSVIKDDNGEEHVRFDKRFKGLRVIGGDIVSHHDANGLLREVSASNKASLRDLSMTPVLDAAGAAVLAESAFTGKRVGPAAAELVISAREQVPVLAYEVILEGFQPDDTPSELHVLVNAHTGKVLESFDMVHTAAATGSGRSLYSGTVSIGTNTITSGGYELRDVTRGNGFYTANLNGATSGTTTFKDADNTWGSGTTSDPASAGVDAHYGQKVTYDYYKNVHGRNGINGTGNVGYSRVHYSSRYNNAFWTDSCFCMTYGDGDGVAFSPLTSLDVAGHEMTHGVTSRTAGLIYSGESGGLNEATSDIFGSMVEFYAANASDAGDYLIGEKIRTPGTAGDALRYMHKPSLDGKSKDCWYSGVGSINVHNSSGVANHFFYLLAQGSNGSPASPTCNGSTVSGIGRAAAEKIWYRALTVYMTSSTNFKAARTATLNAARDLHGSGSTQYNAVAAAWSAVSVN
ncbi:M4 family metallopeptidase [Hyalangium sp.]|uniref:M4 family metallopeptidase n=1 Tax=Hyalangium sp. TaxID=2028555 RepID=UPI002D53498F|nr:M4 family metallopeptidase [Hyalangium sp.]HYI00769.1 M4 family metallopeptidase [Hyalangium sp.]